MRNYLKMLTMELTTLARACGKSNVHHLEREDLVALTVEAAAMAKVPSSPGSRHHNRFAGVWTEIEDRGASADQPVGIRLSLTRRARRRETHLRRPPHVRLRDLTLTAREQVLHQLHRPRVHVRAVRRDRLCRLILCGDERTRFEAETDLDLPARALKPKPVSGPRRIDVGTSQSTSTYATSPLREPHHRVAEVGELRVIRIRVSCRRSRRRSDGRWPVIQQHRSRLCDAVSIRMSPLVVRPKCQSGRDWRVQEVGAAREDPHELPDASGIQHSPRRKDQRIAAIGVVDDDGLASALPGRAPRPAAHFGGERQGLVDQDRRARADARSTSCARSDGTAPISTSVGRRASRASRSAVASMPRSFVAVARRTTSSSYAPMSLRAGNRARQFGELDDVEVGRAEDRDRGHGGHLGQALVSGQRGSGTACQKRFDISRLPRYTRCHMPLSDTAPRPHPASKLLLRPTLQDVAKQAGVAAQHRLRHSRQQTPLLRGEGHTPPRIQRSQKVELPAQRAVAWRCWANRRTRSA